MIISQLPRNYRNGQSHSYTSLGKTIVKEDIGINIEGQKKGKPELCMFPISKANTEKVLKSTHWHMKQGGKY